MPRLLEARDPLDQILLTHIPNADMEAPPEALERQDTDKGDRYMRRISADDWRAYLQSAN